MTPVDPMEPPCAPPRAQTAAAPTRRTRYRIADELLLVETRDRWSADAIDSLFAGWYLTPVARDSDSDGDGDAAAQAPAIVMCRERWPAPIPVAQAFEVAGGGLCSSDGAASYIAIGEAIVAIGAPGHAAVEIWTNGPLPFDAPALTRLVTYALAAALRRRQHFELHGAALTDPDTGRGLLIVGPSGSGKSTLTVHLASAGWPFLTDDVMVLSRAAGEVTAWPLRRCFAVTAQTYAASPVLQARTSLDQMARQADDKHQFQPHALFADGFRECCVPGTLLFPELTGAPLTRVARLSTGDAMARLIRMSPWSCYDRSTAPAHLALLAALATQSASYALFAGRDLLDPDASVRRIADCIRAS